MYVFACICESVQFLIIFFCVLVSSFFSISFVLNRIYCRRSFIDIKKVNVVVKSMYFIFCAYTYTRTRGCGVT